MRLKIQIIRKRGRYPRRAVWGATPASLLILPVSPAVGAAEPRRTMVADRAHTMAPETLSPPLELPASLVRDDIAGMGLAVVPPPGHRLLPTHQTHGRPAGVTIVPLPRKTLVMSFNSPDEMRVC